MINYYLNQLTYITFKPISQHLDHLVELTEVKSPVAVLVPVYYHLRHLALTHFLPQAFEHRLQLVKSYALSLLHEIAEKTFALFHTVLYFGVFPLQEFNEFVLFELSTPVCIYLVDKIFYLFLVDFQFTTLEHLDDLTLRNTAGIISIILQKYSEVLFLRPLFVLTHPIPLRPAFLYILKYYL